MHSSPKMLGYIHHRQTIQVTQGQRDPLIDRQPRERRVRGLRVEPVGPWVIDSRIILPDGG